jgi:Carboxypeptidase regulatory-like domain
VQRSSSFRVYPAISALPAFNHPFQYFFSMKCLPLLAFCLIIVQVASAQVNISGRITDEKHQPLGFATVALVNVQDSQVVKGALTDAIGVYQILAAAPGEYRLTARLVGYAPVFSEPFTIKPDSKNVEADLTLQPATTLLNEAVVTAQRQLFEQKADRLVMNVANSPMVAGGTALEMLQKMPGVLVIQDRITVAGSQSVLIFIDGKPSQYADMNQVLRDMPGDQIDRVELITQPGARFDAAGGTVLNVVLKRNANLGFTGTASLTLGGSRYNQDIVNQGFKNYSRYSPSVNMNYRNGQWNLYGNYSYLHRDLFNIMDVARFIGEERYAQRNYNPFGVNVHNYRVGADFFASKKTTVGVLFKGFDRRSDGLGANITEVFDRSTERSFGSFTTENDNASHRLNMAGNLNVKHEFDSKTVMH